MYSRKQARLKINLDLFYIKMDGTKEKLERNETSIIQQVVGQIWTMPTIEEIEQGLSSRIEAGK